MFSPVRVLHAFCLTLLTLLVVTGIVFASDWDEDTPKEVEKSKSEKNHSASNSGRGFESNSTLNGDGSSHAPSKHHSSNHYAKKNGAVGELGDPQVAKPLEGKIEKSHSSLRIQRQEPQLDSHEQERLQTKAIDDELRGSLSDSALKNMDPSLDDAKLLQGRTELQGGKPGRFADPDEDDAELLVEWDRWHNRFLRAVQLGTQENVNNPDPEDYERPRVDPRTGAISSRYPLGTGAAFSCVVTDDGHIKNLEIFEPSGFSKYDRAVLRAVQALEGTQILRFPKGSHRRTVMQPGRIKTATSSDFKFHHFGDIEHIRN